MSDIEFVKNDVKLRTIYDEQSAEFALREYKLYSLRDPLLYVTLPLLAMSIVFASLFGAGVLEYAFTRVAATAVLFAFSAFFLIRFMVAYRKNAAEHEERLYFALPTSIEATFGSDAIRIEEDTIDECAPEAVHETYNYAYTQLKKVIYDEVYTVLFIKPTGNSISIIAIRNSDNAPSDIERAVALLNEKVKK